jgi:adenosine kinase
MGMPVDHIRQIPEAFTAQAFITTDLDDNQITAFHPGAMQYAHLNTVTDALAHVADEIALGSSLRTAARP